MRPALGLLALLVVTGCSGSGADSPVVNAAPSASVRGPAPAATLAPSCAPPSSAPLASGTSVLLTLTVDSLGRVRELDVDGGRYQVPPGPPLVPGSYQATVTRDGDLFAVLLPPASGGPAIPVTMVGPLGCG